MGFQIGFKDIVDIVLVAILLYQLFLLLKKSGALNVFLGILSFLIIWYLVSYVFKMELLGGIFDRVVSVGAFALIVLFQDEIRRFFSRLGTKRKWVFGNMLKKFFGNGHADTEKTDYNIVQIVLACRSLAKRAEGGLIVLTRKNNLETHAQTGEVIDAMINSRLIENLFFKNSPLHDGAMIISNDRIYAVSCILPVSKNQQIPKRLGLRHRSALGITEQTDAIAIVISEETGKISYAINGELTLNVKPEELEMLLSEALYAYK
ncbi:MAG: diadenylate cyclase CdaA [Paludibacter sp.]|nr:diadenylate cyclase CdaA [Paludibacter sp.]MDD4197929.1 diadenylate cyclase CdaA [Paludibacter sp.]MDD4427256.1 diadenylate cyclase CdaA [Paludibacter sp.]